MSIKNARTLGVRLDEHDTKRLEQFEKATSIEGVSLARASLKASLDYYEQHGEISVPIKLVIAPKQAPSKIVHLREHIQGSKVAEEPGEYGKGNA